MDVLQELLYENHWTRGHAYTDRNETEKRNDHIIQIQALKQEGKIYSMHFQKKKVPNSTIQCHWDETIKHGEV